MNNFETRIFKKWRMSSSDNIDLDSLKNDNPFKRGDKLIPLVSYGPIKKGEECIFESYKDEYFMYVKDSFHNISVWVLIQDFEKL